jgi:tRNA 2-thiouridine synthesizing protein E
MPMTSINQEIMNPSLGVAVQPGFPYAPMDWTPAAAEQLADAEGLGLTEAHWELLAALQEYYARHERIQVRELYDALEERFHARGGMKYLYGLLPRGPVAQGCRLAGLEPPAGATNPSFGSVQ